jgi:hypothetical protein
MTSSPISKRPTTKAVNNAVPIYQTGGYSPEPTTKAVRLRQCAARRRPVRPQGARQHLHTDHESDAGCARAAAGRARGRHRGARLGLRPGGSHLFDPHDCRSRRQYRGLERALRRHLQSVRPHAAAIRHRGALCRLPRSRSFEPLDRRQTKAVFVESLGNPQGNVTDIEADRPDRPPAWRAPDRGQHRAHALLCAGPSSMAPTSSCIR